MHSNKQYVNKINKRDSGAATKLIPLIFSIVVIAMLLSLFMNWMQTLNKKEEIDLIARKYLLIAETEGYFKNENLVTMTNELKSVGLTSVTYGSTTVSPVSYGAIITLEIIGVLPVKYYILDAPFSLQGATRNIDVYVTRKTTAKY